MTMPLEGPRRPAAEGAADSLVVLLHGYGADGNDLFGLAEPLSTVLPRTAFVSPNAPERCRVNPMGRQWFPIPWIDGSAESERDAAFAASVAALDAFLDNELAGHGLSADRLALVGFSQGTMMSLHVGPRRNPGPACIVGFSGRLAVADDLAAAASKPPVFLLHGDADDVLPVSDMHDARAALSEAGFQVRWKVHAGLGHGIAPEGLGMAAGFLRDALGPSSGA